MIAHPKMTRATERLPVATGPHGLIVIIIQTIQGVKILWVDLLDNVVNGDVEKPLIERLHFNDAPGEGTTKVHFGGVYKVNSLSSEPGVGLVFQNEHNVR